MEIEVSRFRECDIDTVFTIQQAAFKPLYEKYHDDDTSPYLESKEAVLAKYTRTDTAGYLFSVDGRAGNCHLYEKIGYRKTGKTEVIHEKMTLVFYEKKTHKFQSAEESS